MNNFLDLLKLAQESQQPVFVYLEQADEAVVVLSLAEYKKLTGKNFSADNFLETRQTEIKKSPQPRTMLEDETDEIIAPAKFLADLSQARPRVALEDLAEPNFDFESFNELDGDLKESDLSAAEVIRRRAKKLSGGLVKKKKEGAFPGEQADDWE